MPITFRCASCKKQYKVSSKHAGKMIDCKNCQSKMQIPVVKTAPVQPQPAAAPAPAPLPSFPTAGGGFAPVQQPAPVSPAAVPPAPAGFQQQPQPPAKMATPMPSMTPMPPQKIAAPMPPAMVQAPGRNAQQPQPAQQEELLSLSMDDIVDGDPDELAAVDLDQDDFVSIQTEWTVECDDCGRKHTPDEKLMGKRIRCKCGTVLHLSENVNAGLMIAKDEDELPTLAPVPEAVAPSSATGFQSAPPTFQQAPAHVSHRKQQEEQRRRDARALVRRAAQDEQWERTHVEEGAHDEEWGPMGKIIGGVALIAAGVIVGLIAYQAGYIVGVSFWLVGIGVLSLGAGLVETFMK